MILVVDANMSIEIMSASAATVIAEDVSLRQLALSGSGGLASFWVEAKNLTISSSLQFSSSQGGMFVEGLTMPSNSSAVLKVRDGTIDIITNDAPSFVVTSVNDAVCFVGQMEDLTKSVQNVTKVADGGANANSTTTRTGSFTCLGAQACNRPSFDLSITGDCLSPLDL